jgi:hypothetical protein
MRTTSHRDILVVHVSGKLTKQDYLRLVPEFDRLVQKQGKINMLFEMRRFRGWEPAALWKDIKLEFNHFKDIKRLAMVGENRWAELMSRVSRPFTTAEIRYFDRTAAKVARAWVQGGLANAKLAA